MLKLVTGQSSRVSSAIQELRRRTRPYRISQFVIIAVKILDFAVFFFFSSKFSDATSAFLQKIT